ncbi:MAG: basic amino acid ABC transporter substrate-binding protein [Limnochordia bacterium]|jgi:polar amino acid transport system substrate-binding protein
MNRVFGIITVVFLLLFAVSSAFGAEKIRVGSDMTFAPFEFIDEQTKAPAGFDIEYMKALGDVMGVDIEFSNVAWDGIIPGLLVGQYDLLIAAMTITEERSKAIDFSDPYFTTGQVIVVRKGTKGIKGTADLRGKIISVQIGTTGQFEAEKIPGIRRIDKYPTIPEAFVALKQGRADASIVDELVALEELRLNPGATEIMGKPFSSESYGIGIKKGRPDLLRRVNQAIATLKANGTYDRLRAKWMGSAQ